MRGLLATVARTPAAQPPQAEAIDDASLRRVSERLTAATGLTFPRSRQAGLRRALGTAMLETPYANPDALLDELDRQPELLDRLISLVTIGETYFFRHPDQFEALSRHVVPNLIRAREGSSHRVIRAWSAGCSTGEEAYSLAIVIRETLADQAGWQVRVVGTDIDRDALRRAADGRYGRWSFRDELGSRAAWFVTDGSSRSVRSSIAQDVEFAVDNLALDDGPPPALGGPADLIVCRNVTIYLSSEARRRIARRFLRALAPGGWLVVAPVELSSSIYHDFEAITLDGLTAYRRPVAPATEPRAAVEPSRSPGIVQARSVSPTKDLSPAPSVARPAQSRALPTDAPRSRPDPAARLAAAARLADGGRLPEARREAELAIREDPRNGKACLLLASIADAQGDLPAAAAALRRSVYLDRTDASAQFQLGLLEWRLGRQRSARARLRTALDLVVELPDEAAVSVGTDLTVGRLRNTIKLLGHD